MFYCIFGKYTLMLCTNKHLQSVYFYVIEQDDQEGVRTLDDDNFIDDTGVDPIDRFGSDNEGSAGNAPQVCTLQFNLHLACLMEF